MLTHALLSFLFFIHGFIQIRFFDLFDFFLLLLYEQEILFILDRKVALRKVSPERLLPNKSLPGLGLGVGLGLG